jgi:hypothetical protein
MKILYIKGFTVLLLVASNASLAEIYKCTDAQGKTRYADKPCSDSAVVITPEKAPIVTEDSLRRMDKTQRVTEDSLRRMDKTQRLLRAYDAEHEEERAQKAASKAEKLQRQQKCDEAKHYQRGVTQASRVYAYDKAGQRYDLSTEQRAAEEAMAQEKVEQWCDEK